jgi:hypothetical protein
MGNRNTPRAEKPPARVRNQSPKDADFMDDESMDAGDAPGVENGSALQPGTQTGFDRVVGADEAGLGGGLDQAEEAQLGVTDEELAEMARRRRTPNS